MSKSLGLPIPISFYHGSLEISFLDWHGFNNPNTCLLTIWNNTKNNKNWGFKLLPLKFWQHFFLNNGQFGANNRRFDLGIGIFNVFFDYRDFGQLF